jgi:hypothetical protein
MAIPHPASDFSGARPLEQPTPMDIHFVSTLTPEDEDRYAPAVLAAIQAMLDRMPIAYSVRIRTGSTRVFEHTKTASLPIARDEHDSLALNRGGGARKRVVA